MASQQEMTQAYRRLYRGLLGAVQYASPARYLARDQLRAAFRERGARWDPEGIKRTLWFLQAAARERGLEHRILKNLLRVRMQLLYEKQSWKKNWHESRQKKTIKSEKQAALRHYEMTVAMLNQSMGLCLR